MTVRGPKVSTELIKDILRLKMDVRLSNEQIARSLALSKGVVGKYIGLARKAGLDWSSVHLMNEAEIDQKLRPRPRQPPAYVLPDYGHIHLRLSQSGASLMREWERYNADYAGQKIYHYTQFCEHYHAFVRQLGRSLRQVHRAGEKMFASFSNSSIPLSEGGYAHIFLTSMGASKYAFACSTTEETAIAWIRSADRALHFYGGVPRIIIPEGSNGTIPSDRASENAMMLHFARHYSTAVLLSLMFDSKEKAQAALPVKIIERWILRCLRQRKFAVIEEVEAALQPWLDRLNQRPFRNLPASRASAFAELDSSTLSPLPAQHYEIPISARDLASTEIRRPALENAARAKVLAAEPDPGMRAYLEQLFGRQYQVISVRDGRSALQAALEHKPELIVSGLGRPKRGGLDLLGALRAQAATSPIAFIQLLDIQDGNAHEQGIRTEAEDWIAKPPNGLGLLRKARAMLAVTESRRTAQRREEHLQVASLDILEGLSELFLMVDSEWRIRYLNTAAETAARLPRGYLLARNYWEAFPTMRGTLVEQEYLRTMSSRVTVRFEHYDGRYDTWTEREALPMGCGGILLRAHDITELKRAQAGLSNEV